MKTKFFLLALAALSFTRLSAAASTPSDETAPVQLPAYVVTEPRQTPAERAIKLNLDALRAVAAKPVQVRIALPSPEFRKLHAQTEAKTPAHSVIVAGL